MNGVFNHTGTSATFLQRSGQVLWGVIIALLPKCGLCLTAYLHLLGIMGISFSRYYELMLPLLAVLLSASLAISFIKARKSKDYRAIFFAVGVEVMAGDTIGNYGLYHGISLDVAKNYTSYTLSCMMVGYIAGILAIPRFITQQKAFYLSSWLGLILTLLIVVLPGKASIFCVALSGLANAILWPAIWPQALKGLEGKLLAKGSAVLIMGIAGGALMPLLYGWTVGLFNNQYAYCILVPAYMFLVYYSYLGKQTS